MSGQQWPVTATVEKPPCRSSFKETQAPKLIGPFRVAGYQDRISSNTSSRSASIELVFSYLPHSQIQVDLQADWASRNVER